MSPSITTIPNFHQARNMIIITDVEPDDRKALDVFLAHFDEKNLQFIGTGVMHAGRKKALVRRILDQNGLSAIPVFQGTGGTVETYPKMSSTKAATTYMKEGQDILSEARIKQIQLAPHSSDKLKQALQKTLEVAKDKSIEIALLAPPTDLVEVLRGCAALKEKIKHIYIMGGWVENNGDLRTTYNWNMDLDASSELMQMTDIPMTLISSDLIKRSFTGGTICSKNYPKIIEIIEKCKSICPSVAEGVKASVSWNWHVIETIPVLKKIIEPYIDHQFTPADPAIAVAIVNPGFVKKQRPVKITFDLSDVTAQGCRIHVSDNPESNIQYVEEIDLDIFEHEMISSYQILMDKAMSRATERRENSLLQRLQKLFSIYISSVSLTV